MASGSIPVQTLNSTISGAIDWSSTTDVSTNTSVITGSLWLKRTNVYSYKSYSYDVTTTIYVNGQKFSTYGYVEIGPSYSSAGSDPTTVLTFTTEPISHNDDGNKQVVVSVQMTNPNTNSFRINYAESTITLDTIARKTPISDIYATIGSQYNLVVNPFSSTFTHKLEYYFGSASGSVNFNTNNTLYWTPSVDLHNQIPNAKYGEGTVILRTYSNGVEIGYTSAKLILYANESLVAPTVNFQLSENNPTVLTLTGDGSKMIRNYSNIYIEASISTKYGASVSNQNVNGDSFTGTIYTLSGATTNTYTLTVRDSRGYEVSTTKSLTLIDYSPLGVTGVNVARTEPTSTTVNMNVSLNYWNGSFGLQNNTLTGRYRYKDNSTGVWSDYQSIPFTNASYSTQLAGFDWKKTFTFEFEFVDKLNTLTITDVLPKGLEALSIGDNFIAVQHIYLINENTGEYSLYI